MNVQELREKYGLDKRIKPVKCSVCGKTIDVPSMYSDKERAAVLSPYCCAATVLVVQWLIRHGWHVGQAHPHKYFCPDCFPEGMLEFHESPNAAAWCEQAEKWMKEKTK